MKIKTKIEDTKKKYTKSDEEKALKEKQKQLKWRRKNPKKAKKLADATKTALIGLGMGAGGGAAGDVTKEKSKPVEGDSALPKTTGGKLTRSMVSLKKTSDTSFGKAHRSARDAGLKTFTWKGKKYNTKHKGE